MLFPDHLACPRLSRWLPGELGDDGVRVWIEHGDKKRRPSRALRGLASQWPSWTPDDRDVAALVVVTMLGPDAPVRAPANDALLATLRPAARIVELASLPRPELALWLRPLRRRQLATAWAAARARGFLLSGLTSLEQWVSLDPPDVLLTMGRGPR